MTLFVCNLRMRGNLRGTLCTTRWRFTGVCLAVCLAIVSADLAADDQHWSFVPVVEPPVPVGAQTAAAGIAAPQNPLDDFIGHKLEHAELARQPAASPVQWLRRVTLDLTGLPPTVREMQAFTQSAEPDAQARLADDLLARPAYGERYGRHWLDVARFAETNGYERDGPKLSVWRFRDYVVSALNIDLPYDQFVTQQIAGDEIPASDAVSQTAATFLRLGTWDDEPAEPMADRYDQLDDVLGTTATAFMGITLRCARCHDHKFEPFSQVDYYRMLAIFEPLKRPQQERTEFDCPVGTKEELTAYELAKAAYDQQLAAAKAVVEAKLAAVQERLYRPLASAATQSESAESANPESENSTPENATSENAATENSQSAAPAFVSQLPPPAIAALLLPVDQRNDEQKQLLETHRDLLSQEVDAALLPQERNERDALQAAWQALKDHPPASPPRAYIWEEAGPTAPETALLKRGDPFARDQVVAPGFPEVLVASAPHVGSPQPQEKTTGRRLWLARWLTSPNHPLTARVWVNRLWQWHFGNGLVPSENDLGTIGDMCTHPELLNYLAARLMAHGWSTKWLHRQVVLSATYGQGSGPNQQAARRDPDCRLLWHWPIRRLEAEAYRDHVLAVTGSLNRQMAGPSICPPLPEAVKQGQSRPGDGWTESDPVQSARRSVYVLVKRVLAVPELELLDTPDSTSSCEQRVTSTTGPQSLTLWNGPWMNDQANQFARLLQSQCPHNVAAQIELAFQRCYGRLPTAPERLACEQFLADQAAQITADTSSAASGQSPAAPPSGIPLTAPAERALSALCLVLLNSSEFMYVP